MAVIGIVPGGERGREGVKSAAALESAQTHFTSLGRSGGQFFIARKDNSMQQGFLVLVKEALINRSEVNTISFRKLLVIFDAMIQTIYLL